MPKKLIPIGSVIGGTRVYRGEFPDHQWNYAILGVRPL